LAAAHAGQTVVLVTHGVIVRLIVLQALGLGPERLWVVHATPAGISEIEYRPDSATLHRMNTLRHVQAPPAPWPPGPHPAAPDRAHRRHPAPGRAAADPPRLPHERLPLRRAAGRALPRVLPGRRRARRAREAGG